jgi:hypothetical protein
MPKEMKENNEKGSKLLSEEKKELVCFITGNHMFRDIETKEKQKINRREIVPEAFFYE